MQDLFAPALAQFALTFVLGLLTAGLRLKAGLRRQVDAQTLKVGGYGWPKQVQQVGNAFNNQFESPIYFFAAIVIAMIAGISSPLVVALAWLYVAARAAHALVYATVNIVMIRFLCFITGFAVLGVLWLAIALEIFART